MVKNIGAFLLALIGGGLEFLGSLYYSIISVLSAGGLFGYLILILAIPSIVSVVGAFKMKDQDDKIVKKWSIVTIIIGVLSANLLVIIGGVIGLMKSKNSGEQIMEQAQSSQETPQTQNSTTTVQPASEPQQTQEANN